MYLRTAADGAASSMLRDPIPPPTHLLIPPWKAEEDERRELHRRFQAEGLDSRLLPDATKLVHVWRWLMDAETNCTSLRYQMDKLHRQQAADMQDLERYVDQVHSLLEEKVSRVQQENHTLRQELEPARDARLLLIHEGLSELAHATLAEQMAFLLAERARYKEQLEIEQKRRRSIEKNRKIAANEATQHQQQSSRSQSDDSEGGNSKSEANERIAKLEEELRIAKTQVQQLVSYIQNPENKKDESHKTWVDNILVDHQQSDWSDSEVTKLAEVQDENRDLRDKVSFLEKTNRQLELDNETLAYKLSEALAQYDDLENELRLERMRPQGGASRQDSPSKSRFNYQKNTLDNRISMQKQDAMLVDQLRKAQHEVASLQSQLTATGRQLQLLMVRGHERKARHQERIQKLRDVLERETQHAEERERELVRTQTHLRREVEQRLRLEMDCKTLQEDKRQLLERLVDKDEEIIRLAQMLNGVQRTQVTLDRKSDYSTDSVSEKNMESEELKE
ncbi:trichohyalin-like [Ornithodoros turicata]|uniref:trichohyalin-like n=1 Tax=Ornithodoros turicata TaxID=34597 RepID=UPI00313A2DFC